MKNILAVLVNYGEEQLHYLQQVVNELKSFKKYKVTIFVNSNIPLDMIKGIDYVNVIQLDDYQLFPAYHAHYDWDYNSVEEYDGRKFAHFTNIHQATFILTKSQLLNIGEMYDFTTFFGKSHYSVKCKVNTDIYQFCEMKKMICISEFEDNLIHHLPNIYINGEQGRNKLGYGEDKMKKSINKIL